MRRPWMLAVLAASASGAMIACGPADSEPERVPEAALATKQIAPLPLSGPFSCPTDPAGLIPVEDIAVTVRAGRIAREKGRLELRARGDTTGRFEKERQVRFPDAELTVTPDGRSVELTITARPGRGRVQGMQPTPDPFTHTVTLLRCTDDEGNLVRIHVDAPEKGEGGPEESRISVTGIYDRLTSEAALNDLQYSCTICRRVEVCGADLPSCR